ncbi:hypothetical protein MASR2M44_22740 [Bacteroidota bacterium]
MDNADLQDYKTNVKQEINKIKHEIHLLTDLINFCYIIHLTVVSGFRFYFIDLQRFKHLFLTQFNRCFSLKNLCKLVKMAEQNAYFSC